MISGAVSSDKSVVSKLDSLFIRCHVKGERPFEFARYGLFLPQFINKIMKRVNTLSSFDVFAIYKTVVETFGILIIKGLILWLGPNLVKTGVHEVYGFLKTHFVVLL